MAPICWWQEKIGVWRRSDTTAEPVGIRIIRRGKGVARLITAPWKLGRGPRVSVAAFDDGRSYAVGYDLPLDGAWSDLAAQFEFLLPGDASVATLQLAYVIGAPVPTSRSRGLTARSGVTVGQYRDAQVTKSHAQSEEVAHLA